MNGMIDQNILAASGPSVQLLSPAQRAQQQMGLAQMGQNLQAGAINIQNAQQGQVDDQATRTLFQRAVASGKRPTDNEVMVAAGPKAGAALLKAWQEADQTRATIEHLNVESAEGKARKSLIDLDYAGDLAVGLKTAGYSPANIEATIAKAHADGHDQDAALLYQVFTQKPDAVPQVVESAIARSPKQQELMRQKQTADAATANAVTNADRLDSTINNNQQQRDQAAENATETARHNRALEGQADRRIDLSADRANDATPNARGVQQRANEAEYNKASTAELEYRKQHDGIGQALRSGNIYVDDKGKSVAFSQMKNSSGDAVSPSDIQALQAQMRQRYDIATQGMVRAIAAKNVAIQRNGAQPQVSTQQATQALQNPGSQQAPPQAAPQQAPPQQAPPQQAPPQPASQPAVQPSAKSSPGVWRPGTVANTAAAQAIAKKFGENQTVYRGGKAYTIVGIDKDGNFQVKAQAQ